MTLSENIRLFLNVFFPKRKRPGRESPQAYCEAQYKRAQSSYQLYTQFINIKDKNVLDAGCGTGGKTVFYAEQGCRTITGIDIDEQRITLAKEFCVKKKTLNVEFVTGNLASMPLESDRFDIIFLNDVVEHVDRSILIKALQECKRVIKPGGKICLEFPPWTSFDAAHLYDYIYIPWCQVIFSDKTLINVINKLAPKEGTIVGSLSCIEHYKELNRITIEEFKNILKTLGFKVVAFDMIIILSMNFIKYIPFLNKYATRRVMAVLSK